MDEESKKPGSRARKKRFEEAAAEQPADDEPQVEAPPEPESEAADEAEERQPVNVFALAQFYLSIFADLAFQRMGIHADGATGIVVKDMQQAKAAVDIASFLADQIMPMVGDTGKRELMNLVRDLRLNYAKQAQSSSDQAGG
jgi:hypothetical protein